MTTNSHHLERLSLDDYEIMLGNISHSLLDFLNSAAYSQIIILVDETTRRDCLPLVQKSISSFQPRIIEIKSGEINKNIETCQQIWHQLIDFQADRNALLINLGGGVIGDMGGFCASTYKRGIDFIQIPTTLLSQVDASIGGKLGIDFENGKNLIGLFKNPKTVLIDPNFIQTLPDNERKSGFAEMLKHALIDSSQHWQKTSQFEPVKSADWQPLILESLKVKKRIVEKDPFEKGIRKALNLGHSIGHAIETYSLKNDKPALLHGEAVAWGIVYESFLAKSHCNLANEAYQKIKQLVKNIYPTYSFPAKAIPEILQYLKNDKKNDSSQLNMSLLSAIGSAEINQQITIEAVEKSLLHFAHDA